jgi:hypothetical protein
MSESGMNPIKYCAVADVVDRMLIKANDIVNYTTEINYCIVEASRMVDTFLMPYMTVPITGTPADQIVISTADFSASAFKRRYVPSELKTRGNLQPDMINDVDGSAWFALGLKKMLEFIKNNFALGSLANPNPAQNAGTTINPEIYKDLYVKGIITLQEARAYMANADSAITEVLNKVLNTTISEAVTRTSVDRSYPTKVQRSFAFISGQGALYRNKGGYKVDSNLEQNPSG